MALVLEGGRELLGEMGCSTITFTSGVAKGRERYVFAVVGDAVVGGGIGSSELFEGVRPGDEVTIDNSRYLAFCHHYRHQVEPQYREWAHSMVDGKAVYPQRPKLEQLESIYPYTHQIPGKKVALVCNLMDRGCFPNAAAAHRGEYAKVMGDQWVKDNLRIWYNDHCWHGVVEETAPGEPPNPLTTRLIDYQASIHRALRYLVRWVEDGEEPIPSTSFVYTADCDIVVPPIASERGGMQPVVNVTANGRTGRVDVKVGEAITFTALAEAPSGTGKIVAAAWDFDGSGSWPLVHREIDGKSEKVTLTASHRYSKPGTYFAAVRVTSHPDGNLESPLYRLPNLGRIRVIVS